MLTAYPLGNYAAGWGTSFAAPLVAGAAALLYEDDPTLEPGLMIKRVLPKAGLAVLPRSGHALNLEDAALFNRVVEDFFRQVESGRWA